MIQLCRGARPSPRHRLAAAVPHTPVPAPEQFYWKPVKLSMWGNDQYGDCTVAEEASTKARGPAGIFIPDSVVLATADKFGALDGDSLIDVVDQMETGGFPLDGRFYDDGAPQSVDWTNASILESAIAQGPVKIGIAADQLQTVYQSYCSDGPQNGWLATGFTEDPNEDHCVSLNGFGPLGWLCEELEVSVPQGQDQDAPFYTMFTWSTDGLIDAASLNAICGEAWLRTPTTVIR